MIHVGDWAAQNSNKNLLAKTKIQNLEPEARHTQKVSISTGIFWLSHISTPHYKHFTIQGMLFSDLSAELEDIL